MACIKIKVCNSGDNFIKKILCDDTNRCSYIYSLLEEANKARDLESEKPNFEENPFLKAIRKDVNGGNFFWWLFDFAHSSNLRNRTWLVKLICSKRFITTKNANVTTFNHIVRLTVKCNIQLDDQILNWDALTLDQKINLVLILIGRNEHSPINVDKVSLWKKTVCLLRRTLTTHNL